MDELDTKLFQIFEGKVVRKDLVRKIKGSLNVPIFVLEYLLGKYCSSEDPEVIKEGINHVKSILKDHFVRPDERELIKSKIKENGHFRIIDKVKVELIETEDKYWAKLVNLGLDYVNIDDTLISEYPQLLVGGIWGIIDIIYYPDSTHKGQLRPFIIQSLKPIQIAIFDFEDIVRKREKFTTDEWKDILLRSLGFETTKFNDREKLLLLARLLPLIEANYNYVELGPKGTGKSYCYTELSPYSILISGGKVTVAQLFMSNIGKFGKLGLVAFWDVIAFDEVAGMKFKDSDRDTVQILKDYMESGRFSRGKDQNVATASFSFLGNIDIDIKNLSKTSHLFSPFPQGMQDTALLDRIHIYLPGWEIQKMQPRFFGDNYGFVINYLAEFLKDSRKITRFDEMEQYFLLGAHLNTRDTKAIKKTVSGLLKLLHPNNRPTKKEMAEYIEFAIEMRKRVKNQLFKMPGGSEFKDTSFSYIDLETNEEIFVRTPEEDTIEISEESTRKVEKKVKHVTEYKDTNLDDISKIQDLLNSEESDILERKSSFFGGKDSYDPINQEFNIARTIAAFLNSNGGVLILGQQDDMEITGIEGDISKSQRMDKDGFQLEIFDAIRSYLSPTITSNLCKVYFNKVEDKQLAIIKCDKSHTPIYFKAKSRKPKYNPQYHDYCKSIGISPFETKNEFWVKSGNGKVELKDPRDLDEYLKNRFR